MTKILLIGSHHGHELLGDHLFEYIKEQRPELLSNIDFKIANPQAKEQGIRFIESDMNRSYNDNNETFEEQLASDFLNKVRTSNYDFVMDLHTTTVIGEPAIITANLDKAMSFINSSSIKKIVKMPTHIAKVSFIGRYPNSVSIEVNEDDAKNPEILNGICDDIDRYLDGKKLEHPREYFEVTEYLRGSELTADELNKIKNFAEFRGEFYPVLVGEQSYDPEKYLGFKAKRLEIC
ncbi:succinylglutamate desuccinylase/aspartoacylase family protein [Candidatus Saccharibacteria bacterium]|nr:succinylglutamate desuccinylase/aspartoacylase family protein [Candidatus Saccharibacteria bacterium]